MNKYLKIEQRIEEIEKWKQSASKLTLDKSQIVLDEKLDIQNDVSDFIEKIHESNGSMVLLREQKGSFGFPFETVLDNFKWFTKLIVYDIDIDSKIKVPKNYFELKDEEKLEFHKKIISTKNISVNTEPLIQSILTKLVFDKITPHICLLYGSSQLYEKKHEDIIRTLVKKHKRDEKEFLLDSAKVLMTEWANQGELIDYILAHYKKWSKETWNTLLFQMIAMLALINEKLPSFRHNDLSLSNILVQKTRVVPLDETELGGYYKYTIFDKTYCIPDIGFRILLADFDYASIKEKDIVSEKVDNAFTKKFGAVSEPNPSFDCHMMLNWLSYWVLKLHHYDHPNRPVPNSLKEVSDFIHRTIEPQYRGYNNRYLKHTRMRNGKKVIEQIIPRNILEKDPYFEKFRNYEEWIQERTFIEEYNKPIDKDI